MLTFLAFYVVLYREGDDLYMTEAIPYDNREPTIIMVRFTDLGNQVRLVLVRGENRESCRHKQGQDA